LGKSKQGISIPVLVNLGVISGPVGLGHVKRKHANAGQGEGQQKKKRRRQRKNITAESSVFTFLNAHISSTTSKHEQPQNFVSDTKIKQLSTQELQKSFTQSQQDSEQLRKRVGDLQKSLDRNKKDKAMASVITEKIDRVKKQLFSLDSKGQELEFRLKLQADRKKLFHF